MRVYAFWEDAPGCEKVVDRMREAKCNPDVQTFNILLYAHRDSPHLLRKVFDRISAENLVPDLQSYCQLMLSYSEDEGCGAVVDEVFQQMLAANILPTEYAYTCRMRAHDSTHAQVVFEEMNLVTL